jgi:hypothetical protein
MRRDLVETTQIMHGNMNTLLERGDKVENLVRKSDVLAESGKVPPSPFRPFTYFHMSLLAYLTRSSPRSALGRTLTTSTSTLS